MTTGVLIDPKVRVVSLRELVRDNLVVLKYRIAAANEPLQPTKALVCSCRDCEWVGTNPLYTDTRDAFNPPRGDIPRCPTCGSFQLGFHLKDASHAR